MNNFHNVAKLFGILRIMEEKMTKPAIGLAILIALVLSTAFIPASWFGVNPVQKQYSKIILPSANDLVALQGDTNKNGTSDWRELLQKTYTTTVTSTTSKVQPAAKVDPEVQKRLDDPNNLTASFAKNMYVANAYIKEKGITDKVAQQQLIQNVVKAEAEKIITKTYTQSDLNISNDESKPALIAYGNALANILTLCDKYNFVKDDLTILNTFNTTKKASDLAPLVEKSKNIDLVTAKLLAMKVPASAIDPHLVALNRISAYKTVIDGFSKADTDPVRAALVIKQYQDTATLLVKSIYRFSDYFTTQNVTFAKNDAGSYFTLLYKNIH